MYAVLMICPGRPGSKEQRSSRAESVPLLAEAAKSLLLKTPHAVKLPPEMTIWAWLIELCDAAVRFMMRTAP